MLASTMLRAGPCICHRTRGPFDAAAAASWASLHARHHNRQRQIVRATASSSGSSNPLEQLRFERDPVQRSKLLSSLDSTWSAWTERYQPTDIEQLLAKELGVDPYNVMMLAVGSTGSSPPLCTYDLSSVKGSIHALKAANIDVTDIWFLASKRLSLLSLNEVLMRWLDFLSVYGLKHKDLVNFLLRAPQDLFEACTLYQAGQVVGFLKQLGIKDEFLAQRVFAVWPAVLCKDVEGELRPVVQFLAELGIKDTDIAAMVCAWPELLLSKVDSQLAPFAAYLKDLGCSTAHVAEILTICPHLLGFKQDDLFGHRVRSLNSIGVGPEDVRAMVNSSRAWLTASGGVQPQLDFLLTGMGLSAAEARQLVVACPDVLAEKDIELQRKWHFIQGTLGCGKDLAMACPKIMAVSLMQVLGPRYTFLQSKKLESTLDLSIKAAAKAVQPGKECDVTPGSLAVHALVGLSDEDWCKGVGLPLSEFREYCVHFQTDYNDRLTQDAAKEFQDELKKLGIYEGTD